MLIGVQQARQRPETELGDADSHFSVIDGVNVHWKLHTAAHSSQRAEPGPTSAREQIQSAQQPAINQNLMGFFEASGQEDSPQQQAAPALDGKLMVFMRSLRLLIDVGSFIVLRGQVNHQIVLIPVGYWQS